MDTATKREITKAMKMAIQAKELERQAKELKKKASETLLPLLVAHGVKKYGVEGLGKAVVKTRSGATIVRAKLQENLLLEGIPPDRIGAVIEASSKTWTTEYVEVRSWK